VEAKSSLKGGICLNMLLRRLAIALARVKRFAGRELVGTLGNPNPEYTNLLREPLAEFKQSLRCSGCEHR
jgi:hypothetical protein